MATPEASVVLLTGSSLCHNPRVLKAAGALARAGCDVQVLGAWLEPDLKAQDQKLIADTPFRFVPVLDVTRPGWRAAAAQRLHRARRKAANVLHTVTGLESEHQFGFTIRPLMAHAQKITPDLFIAHSEPALYVAWRLMRQGRRVGVDMEDWFSEDLLPQVRRSRPLKLLRFLEGELLKRGAYASCPSRAMSDALAAEYGCKSPAVIYNAFPWAERAAIDGMRKDRRDPNAISLCWYSQTLGPGRGLEDLAAALALLDRDVEVHLRGRATPGMQEWVRGRLPERWQQRVFFHPLVPHDELLSRVAEHDIGFAGEMKYCRSRDLTVTNKILHYLLGGLAVIASDTAGQREIAVRAHGAVKLYEPGNPQALADVLALLVGAPERLRGAKAAALRAAEQTYYWERQESALIERVLAAVGTQPRRLQAADEIRESTGSHVV
jgi:glycosyltransferase involved in cell wall biosynthesis